MGGRPGECISSQSADAGGTLELDVPSQFDRPRSSIRRVRIDVKRPSDDPKSPALYGVKAKINGSICRARREGRVIEGVQHFSLQVETEPLSDGEVLRDRDVVESVMRTVKPYSLAEGARCGIGRDVCRVSAASCRRGQVLGVDEGNGCRSRNRVSPNGAL